MKNYLVFTALLTLAFCTTQVMAKPVEKARKSSTVKTLAKAVVVYGAYKYLTRDKSKKEDKNTRQKQQSEEYIYECEEEEYEDECE